MSYIDVTNRGFVYEPLDNDLRDLYRFLEKYHTTLDGSRMYEDLVDIFNVLELKSMECED